MTDKPGIGKTVYKQAVTRGINANQRARRALTRIIEEKPGPQTMAWLIAEVALHLGVSDGAFTELDEIGRNAKNGKKDTQKKEG